MNRFTLASIGNHFKNIFDAVQLTEVEEYGYCHLMENYINEIGQRIKVEVYELDCKTYLIKYVGEECVQFRNITALRR